MPYLLKLYPLSEIQYPWNPHRYIFLTVLFSSQSLKYPESAMHNHHSNQNEMSRHQQVDLCTDDRL